MMAGSTARQGLLALVFGVVLVISVSSKSASVILESHAVQITPRDRQLLDTKACRETFNVASERIVARRYSESTPDYVYAEVLCKADENFNSSPVHHVVFCEQRSGDWQCERSELAIRVDAGNHPLVYFANDVDVRIAYNITVKLQSAKRFQGEAIPDLQKSICNIRRFVNFDDSVLPDVFVVACERKEVFLSSWCPQTECPRIIGIRDLLP